MSRLSVEAPEPQDGSAFELDPQSKLRDAPGRLRPMAIDAVQGGQVLLVGEARHGVVGLRLQTSAADAAFRGGGENRHPRTRDQIVDQSGDEHRLARAGKPGDAQPQRAALDIIPERARDHAGFEDDIGQEGQERSGVRGRGPYLGRRRLQRHWHMNTWPEISRPPRLSHSCRIGRAGRFQVELDRWRIAFSSRNPVG